MAVGDAMQLASPGDWQDHGGGNGEEIGAGIAGLSRIFGFKVARAVPKGAALLRSNLVEELVVDRDLLRNYLFDFHAEPERF